MTQLDYLLYLKKQQNGESKTEIPMKRPEHMLLLPERARTAKDWLAASFLLSDREREAVYIRISWMIKNILVRKRDNETTDQVLQSLPPAHAEIFVAERIRIASDLLYKAHLSEFKNILLREQRYAIFDITICIELLAEANILTKINCELLESLLGMGFAPCRTATCLRLVLGVNQELVTLETFARLTEHFMSSAELKSIFLPILELLCTANKELVKEQAHNVLKEYISSFPSAQNFSRALAILFQVNKELITARNIALLRVSYDDIAGTAAALIILFNENATLVNEETLYLLRENHERAETLASFFVKLFNANETLVTFAYQKLQDSPKIHFLDNLDAAVTTLLAVDKGLLSKENFNLLMSRPYNSEQIANALLLLFKEDSELLNNENRKLLGRNSEHVIHIADVLVILFRADKNLINDEMRAILASQSLNSNLLEVCKYNKTLITKDNILKLTNLVKRTTSKEIIETHRKTQLRQPPIDWLMYRVLKIAAVYNRIHFLHGEFREQAQRPVKELQLVINKVKAQSFGEQKESKEDPSKKVNDTQAMILASFIKILEEKCLIKLNEFCVPKTEHRLFKKNKDFGDYIEFINKDLKHNHFHRMILLTLKDIYVNYSDLLPKDHHKLFRDGIICPARYEFIDPCATPATASSAVEKIKCKP